MTKNITTTNNSKNTKKGKPDADKKTLLEILKKKGNVESIVDDWIYGYHLNAEMSIYELLILVLEISGADKEKLKEENFKRLDIGGNKGAAKAVTDQPDSTESYPLVQKIFKYLFNQFQEFWRLLIIKCQTSILYDQYFIEMLMQWFKELGDSHLRGLRHCTVVICTQITNTLITICTQLKKDLNIISRQLTSETQNTVRQAQLKDNQNQTTKQVKLMENIMEKRIFQKILEDRFDDSLPEIRSLVIGPLAQWILLYPSLMLNADHTKYLGRALNDWIADVRLTAVRAVSLLYESDTFLSQLDMFTQTFRHRIEEIAYSDKVVAISVEAIRLVQVMAKHDLLEDADVLKICKLYQIDNQEISMSAGDLIYQQFLENTEISIQAIPQKTDKSGQRQQLRYSQFQAIGDFLEKSNIPVAYYLINSLWDKGYQIFTDWGFYVKYLQELESNDIQDNQLLIILRIFKVSVQIAVGDRLWVYSDQKEPTDKMVIDKDISMEVTSHFISLFPEILLRYKSNFSVCVELIELASYFKVDSYIQSRQQNKFKELLEAIKEILLLHPWESQLTCIGQTLYKLLQTSKTPTQLESESMAMVHEIFKILLKTVKSSSNQLTSLSNDTEIINEEKEKKVSELVIKLNSDLAKLDSIGKLFHFDDEEYDGLLSSLWKGKFNVVIEKEELEKTIRYASSCYSNLITWTLYQEYNVQTNDGTVVPPLNDKLLKLFYMFSEHMYSLITTPDTSPQLLLFSFKLFTDTRLLFSPALDQTALHFYDIPLPMQTPLKDCAKSLLKRENAYNIDLLKQNFLKELLEDIERKKHSKAVRRRFFSKKKKSTKTTTDESETDKNTTDAGETANDTSRSEKDSEHNISDSDVSESEGTKKARDLIRRDLNALKENNFQEDPQSEGRVDDLLLTMMQSIQSGFVPTRLLIEVLKQIAYSPSKRSLELIKEFVQQHPLPSGESESSIIVKALVRFHSQCLEKEVSSNSLFQKQMFSRMNTLASWMITKAIHHDSLPLIIKKCIRFIQHNPKLSKGREFISVIEFMCTNLTTQQEIEMILDDRVQVVFDKSHKYLPFIDKLYKYIESRENELKTPSKGKSKKGAPTKKAPAKPTTITSKKAPPKAPPAKKKPMARKRRRTSKWASSSEEEESSESESESETESEPEEIDTDSENDKQQPKQPIVNIKATKSPKNQITDDNDKESSESSEDFEPSPIKKLKTRR
ncbi:STAG domain-containing protein [Tieghemostelium lacteum]|uniref:STAG domain-containing protein n=1 Tax=Tieghemostelium lacteum TaxID=361077 RepID=A0A151ZK12_TIELA|nr:STAG domain-containing protein [Tieghemostelium lacteum]|eukprot:KYQ94286.1 STAG domain-containing protein [Tieghemostelium lacteum]